MQMTWKGGATDERNFEGKFCAWLEFPQDTIDTIPQKCQADPETELDSATDSGRNVPDVALQDEIVTPLQEPPTIWEYLFGFFYTYVDSIVRITLYPFNFNNLNVMLDYFGLERWFGN